MSLEEDDESGAGREEQFKSRMSRMIEKQKEVIARARDPGLNPGERRKASHDVVLSDLAASRQVAGLLAAGTALSVITRACRI